MNYLLIALYIISVPITFGGTFAYFQRKYEIIAEENRESDLLFSVFVAAAPLCGFLVCLVGSGFFKYGFKFK